MDNLHQTRSFVERVNDSFTVSLNKKPRRRRARGYTPDTYDTDSSSRKQLYLSSANNVPDSSQGKDRRKRKGTGSGSGDSEIDVEGPKVPSMIERAHILVTSSPELVLLSPVDFIARAVQRCYSPYWEQHVAPILPSTWTSDVVSVLAGNGTIINSSFVSLILERIRVASGNMCQGLYDPCNLADAAWCISHVTPLNRQHPAASVVHAEADHYVAIFYEPGCGCMIFDSAPTTMSSEGLEVVLEKLQVLTGTRIQNLGLEDYIRMQTPCKRDDGSSGFYALDWVGQFSVFGQLIRVLPKSHNQIFSDLTECILNGTYHSK